MLQPQYNRLDHCASMYLLSQARLEWFPPSPQENQLHKITCTIICKVEKAV